MRHATSSPRNAQQCNQPPINNRDTPRTNQDATHEIVTIYPNPRTYFRVLSQLACGFGNLLPQVSPPAGLARHTRLGCLHGLLALLVPAFMRSQKWGTACSRGHRSRDPRFPRSAWLGKTSSPRCPASSHLYPRSWHTRDGLIQLSCPRSGGSDTRRTESGTATRERDTPMGARTGPTASAPISGIIAATQHAVGARSHHTAPIWPTRAMSDAHEVSHLPYRDWCSACVRGHGKSQPHSIKDHFLGAGSGDRHGLRVLWGSRSRKQRMSTGH